MRRGSSWLAVPREYVAHGTPVFIAGPPPAPEEVPASLASSRFMQLARRSVVKAPAPKEFAFPGSWQALLPDLASLDAWRPGWAVCAVTGVQFDVIDVDPRNGGDVSLAAIMEAGLLPPVYGEVITPSGGRHLYIARTGFRKGSPAAGIDLQAGDASGEGRGFVYIPPTIRTSKTDGVQKVYQIAQAINWEAMRESANHPDAQPWLDFLVSRLGKNWIDKTPAPPWSGDPHTSRQRAYLDKTLRQVCAEVAVTQEGGRNNALNRAGYKLGQLVAGCGLDYEAARGGLVLAGVASGLSEREARYHADRSLHDGMAHPLAVGPFAPDGTGNGTHSHATGITTAGDTSGPDPKGTVVGNDELDAYLDSYDDLTGQS